MAHRETTVEEQLGVEPQPEEQPAAEPEVCELLASSVSLRRAEGKWSRGPLSQLNENVLFRQSRNVLLTGSSLRGGRRTAADEPGRARPAGCPEAGQEEVDHAAAGRPGDRRHRTAGAAIAAQAAAERRPGGELRRVAGRYLREERREHTLQPTALVHEAYLRLVAQTGVEWQNRAHFLGIAAQMMRRILVDHARGRRRMKRGAEHVRVPLNEAIVLPDDAQLVALDTALNRLSKIDPRQSRIC